MDEVANRDSGHPKLLGHSQVGGRIVNEETIFRLLPNGIQRDLKGLGLRFAVGRLSVDINDLVEMSGHVEQVEHFLGVPPVGIGEDVFWQGDLRQDLREHGVLRKVITQGNIVQVRIIRVHIHLKLDLETAQRGPIGVVQAVSQFGDLLGWEMQFFVHELVDAQEEHLHQLAVLRVERIIQVKEDGFDIRKCDGLGLLGHRSIIAGLLSNPVWADVKPPAKVLSLGVDWLIKRLG